MSRAVPASAAAVTESGAGGSGGAASSGGGAACAGAGGPVVSGAAEAPVSAAARGASACSVVSPGVAACCCSGGGLNQNIQANMITATRMVAMITLRWSSGSGLLRSGEAKGQRQVGECVHIPPRWPDARAGGKKATERVQQQETNGPSGRAGTRFKINVEFPAVRTSLVGQFVPEGLGSLRQGPRQGALNAGACPVGRAPKEDHDDERIGATYERVYQGVLVHPVDLSQEPADPVALHTALGAGAGRKPDLERHVVPEGVPLHDTVEQPHTPHRHRLHVVAAPVEERPEEATAL